MGETTCEIPVDGKTKNAFTFLPPCLFTEHNHEVKFVDCVLDERRSNEIKATNLSRGCGENRS